MAGSDSARSDPGWIRVVERISGAASGVAAFVALLLSLHVVADVVLRALGERPIPATLEITQFWWMPLLIFLAMPGAQRNREHLRVTLVVDQLSSREQRTAEILAYSLGVLLLILLVVQSGEDAQEAMRIGQTAAGAAIIPVWIVKWAAVGSLTALTLQTIATVYHLVTHSDSDAHAPHESEQSFE